MAITILRDEFQTVEARSRPGDRPPDYAGELERALRGKIAGEVRFDAGSRALYATDGSNYRQVPIGVVVPQSMKVGEAGVLPKVRQAAKEALILADGFSCCTQIEQGTDRRALHLAQVLGIAQAKGSQAFAGDYPERRLPKLPRNDGYLREAVTVGAGLALAGLFWAWGRK
jgi:hypothetical protein